MKCVSYVKYGDLDKIASARAAHFAYADALRHDGKLVIGGPLQNDNHHRVGLLFIYEAASLDEARGFVCEDPFTVANALRDGELSEWHPRGMNLDLFIEAHQAARHRDDRGARSRMFASRVKYTADRGKLSSVRPAHWEYDRTLREAGKLALAGPFANDQGALFVYSAESREEAISYLEHDPMAVERVFAEYEVLEWVIMGLNPQLLAEK